jgi:YegS/Rv2252/BmrU family lipid kinase
MPSGADAAPFVAVAVGLLMLAAVVVIGLDGWRGPGRPRRRLRPGSSRAGQPLPRAAVVANPIKVANRDGRRRWLATASAGHGWAAPLWLETTIEDPGRGQTRAAIRAGADVVIAHGGDGTVRVVAETLAGSRTPLGLLPAGTGNLLARNLGLPVANLDDALAVALTGRDRRIDVGRVELDLSGRDLIRQRQSFLVMAGIGFDAEVMAAVEPRFKQRIGYWAYVVAGVRMLRGPQLRVTLRLDDRPELTRRVRSVIVGNCGELTGGLRLIPDALVDDGWLDVVCIAPRGVVGWAAIVGAVLTRSRRGHPMVQYFRCRRVEIRAEKPSPVQLDGDPAGLARVLRATVDPAALLVRVPAGHGRNGL